MVVNYNKQARQYENTRGIEPLVYAMLTRLIKPSKGEAILDFGCGTGNYLVQLAQEHGIEPYGIEPSESMRKIAQGKLSADRIRDGDHTRLPFPKGLFEKIFLTDVIHHIRELNILFQNLKYVAASSARLCICTESFHQLGEKYWIKYFPDVLKADLERFHSIEKIVIVGEETGWVHTETLTIEDELIAPISSNFIARVEQRTLSAFHLISESAYDYGLALMKADYQAKVPLCQHEGYTFIVFERGNHNGV